VLNKQDFGKTSIKVAASIATVALGLTVAVAPASAATDVNLDQSTTLSRASLKAAGRHSTDGEARRAGAGRSDATGVRTIGDQSSGRIAPDAMPENPSQKLPDKVNQAIPDDATVVSPDLAVTKDGQVKNIQTGKPVTDPKVVGRDSKPADPLAKTDGRRFIPVDAKDVKQAVAATGGDANATDANPSLGTDASKPTVKDATPSRVTRHGQDVKVHSAVAGTNGVVRNASLQNNEYGAYWGTYNGSQAFFERGGNLFAQQAKGVVDVSQWQGTINWEAAKASGVEGAIIRLSFGWGNGYDTQAVRNIRECRRLGIPFGVYVYSYAYDNSTAAAEGDDVVGLLRAVGVNPGDLSYPVFYDLEAYSPWSGHSHPENPWVYDGMVNTWYSRLQAAGYNDLSVYSYTSYLYNQLNTGNIHGKTRWVASYGARTGFGYSTNDRGWQYADNGRVNGIQGNVDINAFGNYNYVSSAPDISGYQASMLPNDTYYISSLLKDSAGLDIPGGSTVSGTKIQLYDANRSKAQQYRLTRHSQDGTYEIRNVNSGKALDVPNGNAHPGAPVQQWDPNDSDAQRWYLRNTGEGGMYIQSKLGNFVLNLPSYRTANGTGVCLEESNYGASEQFLFSTVADLPGGYVRISSSVGGDKVMDVTGASHSNGARIQTYTFNDTDAQKFMFRQVGNAIYEIVNAGSGKMIDLSGGSVRNGNAIQQYDRNSTCSQHWLVRQQGSGRYSFYSGCTADKAIDVPGGRAQNGDALQIYDGNGTLAQKWRLEVVKTSWEYVDDFAAMHRSEISDGVYSFGSKNRSSQVLDVSGGSFENLAPIQLYSRNWTGAQSWRVSHDSAGYVIFTNTQSGKVLDVPGGRAQAGADLQQYQLNGTRAQKWIGVREGDSYKFVSALDTNLVLDVSGGSITNGAHVQLYTNNNTGAQRWIGLQ
jgi:GH25 family lysozyme M1 (1,4-beta-N-acetylmuramidase)